MCIIHTKKLHCATLWIRTTLDATARRVIKPVLTDMTQHNLFLDLREMAAKLQSFNLDKTSILVILDQVLYRNLTPCISMRSNISCRLHRNQMVNKELCETHLHTCTFTSSHQYYCRYIHNNTALNRTDRSQIMYGI